MIQTARQLSDAELVQQCLKGDGVAWWELQQRYEPMLKRCIRRVLRRGHVKCSQIAEDLMAELWSSLFVGGYRRLRAWNPERKLSPFLAAIARNNVSLYLR